MSRALWMLRLDAWVGIRVEFCVYLTYVVQSCLGLVGGWQGRLDYM